MPSRSAGLLLYRRAGATLEVLLGHLGGPYFARRDDGAWSIPKGEYDADEQPLAAALREFTEEFGAARAKMVGGQEALLDRLLEHLDIAAG